MQIPEYFRDQIARCFGERGEEWLTNLPQILNQCLQKWDLTECRIAEGLSINLVCFAQSPDYGNVVLKVGAPHSELYTEMKALTLYQGRNICKCYDSDMELGAFLLERVNPGQDLTSVKDIRAQLMIAADLIVKLPIPIPKNLQGLPTYSDWINRAFTRARKENLVGEKMLSLIEVAEQLFIEIENGDRPKVLLHGDLHHWNILQDENEGWKAIDPHGVIGVPCMESARFMNNHIDEVEGAGKLDHLDDMVTVFSTKFGESKRTIAICLFVLDVLSTCWTFEEAKPDKEELMRKIDRCQFIFDYIRSLK